MEFAINCWLFPQGARARQRQRRRRKRRQKRREDRNQRTQNSSVGGVIGPTEKGVFKPCALVGPTEER